MSSSDPLRADRHRATNPDVDATVDAGSSDGQSAAVFAPALLLLVELHRSSDGTDDVHLHAGGQGYWIWRMIQALGAHPVRCAAVGG